MATSGSTRTDDESCARVCTGFARMQCTPGTNNTPKLRTRWTRSKPNREVENHSSCVLIWGVFSVLLFCFLLHMGLILGLLPLALFYSESVGQGPCPLPRRFDVGIIVVAGVGPENDSDLCQGKGANWQWTGASRTESQGHTFMSSRDESYDASCPIYSYWSSTMQNAARTG